MESARRRGTNSAVVHLIACVALSLGAARGTLFAQQEQDLRVHYGTDSLEAAQAMDQGMRLIDENRWPEALAKAQEAVRIDPEMTFGWFQVAWATESLGDMDAAFGAYQRVEEISQKKGMTSVTLEAAINRALLLAKVRRLDESRLWFTRAILWDPTDSQKRHWKAYRNMAIGLAETNHPLSAAWCALLGYKADRKHVEVGLVQRFMQKAAEAEGAEILAFPSEPNVIRKRTAPALIQAGPDLDEVEGAVRLLLLDAKKRRVFAFPADSEKIHILDYSHANKVSTISAPAKVLGASLVGSDLYVSLDGPPRIVSLDTSKGCATRTWNLSCPAPYSFAIHPARGLAAFPVKGLLSTLDLETGAIAKTDFACHQVALDPTEQFIYSSWTDQKDSGSGVVIIDGQPFFFQSTDFDWSQTTLFRFAIVGKGLLLASVRQNAASNGRYLHLSPDGRWVTVVGGGGWRPQVDVGGKCGYGAAVLPTTDFEAAPLFFPIEAYSQSAAVNPVSGQVAVVRSEEVLIAHLAEPGTSTSMKGVFEFAVSWSGDGRFLYVAKKAGGLQVFENQLSDQETQGCDAWIADLDRRRPKASLAAPAAKAAEPVVDLGSFRVSKDKAEVIKAIQRAARQGRSSRPAEWSTSALYQTDDELKRLTAELNPALDAREYGLLVYRVRELRKTHPENPGLDFLLGYGLFQTRQLDKAEEPLLWAIRGDQGRTSLAGEALRCLAHLRKDQGDPLGAAYCCAWLLYLDLADPRAPEDAVEFITSAGLSSEAKELLAKLGGSQAPGQPRTPHGLPSLPKASVGARLEGTELYERVSPSVVRIQVNGGGGTGVCVAEGGWILNNAHVLAGAREAEVYPFAWENGKLKRLGVLKATLQYVSEREDLAVLRVADPPKSLVPVPVADADPRAGERVYAIGSPDLGGDVLDQSMSEGIVSTARRQLEGVEYVQHTAAVNPGNSGGPLLDEKGQLIGLVTLKAELEGVSFAIPSRVVREAFEGKGK